MSRRDQNGEKEMRKKGVSEEQHKKERERKERRAKQKKEERGRMALIITNYHDLWQAISQITILCRHT